MRLLVAGLQHVWLLDTENDDSFRSIVSQPNGYTFGVTWDSTEFYIAKFDEVPHIVTLDSNFRIKGSQPAEFGERTGPHQLYYNPNDGKLYWCMANLDIVKARNPDGGEWEDWEPCKESREDFLARMDDYDWPKIPKTVIRGRILDPMKDPEFKYCHYINSVWFDDNDNGYVMSHNKGPSEIVACHHRATKTRTRCGNSCHNVWKEGKDTFYCDSANGKIRRLGSDTPLFETHYFPRGVAFDGERRYLGMSFNALQKEGRERMNSHIVITDKDWNVERVIDCPFKGEIYDIRALCVDQCHNRLEPPRR